MRDYKAPWNRNAYRLDDLEIRDSNPIATCACIILLGMLVFWMLNALVDAVEVETLQQYGVAERPQAYRKQPPTHEQMWAMDHLLAVQEVVKAGGKQ
jgi:hypothetical protein